MPVVINLLSSPELPPVRETKRVDIPASPKLALPSKALTYDAQKRRNGDWLTLSSDSIDNDSFLLPKPPKPPSNRNGSKPSSSASTRPKSSLNTTSKPPQSTNTSKPSNDFFYLSDDVDSTFNLDDPFASDSPPAKKRRLSPPSDPSMITRLPEYQRWISKLEKSTKDGPNDESSKSTTSSASTYKSSVSAIGALEKSAGTGLSNTTATSATYKRLASDVGASSKFTAPKTNAGGPGKSKTVGTVFESDPIVFTSSPNPLADARTRKEKTKDSMRDRVNQMLAVSSDDEIFDLYAPKKRKGKVKSTGHGRMTSGYGNVLHDFEFDSSGSDLPDIGALASQAKSKKSEGQAKRNSVAMTALDKYEAGKAKEKKQKEKEQKAKDKLAAKEAEKEQKRLTKEEKAREKGRAAELAKVNILRTDKKKSTLEMIVDLPSCLNPRVAEQIQTFLKPVEAEHSQYESEQPIIKWRRKIDAEYNEKADHWEPVESYIGREKHVMCVMTAKEFVDLAIGEEGKDLDSHVLRLKARFATNEIIYLIEGLNQWMRKNKNVQNRKYVQEVRNQMPEDSTAPTASQKRKKKPEPEYVDEDLVEDALLKLQVMHGVLIHHTKVAIETAEWVIVFTQHISTIPYRYVSYPQACNAYRCSPLRAQQQSLDTAFCMESGQVKTGDGPVDTFTKMLQEMVRITAPVAYGIAAEYPTVQKLVKGFKENGPLALEDCRKMANKDGAFTDKRVGPSISKRVYNMFMSRDAESWDV